MVQVVHINPTQRIGTSQLMGEAFGHGVKQSISTKLNEMLEEKQYQKQVQRNSAQNTALFGEDYGGAEPKIAAVLHELKTRYGEGAQRAIEDANAWGKRDGGGPGRAPPPGRPEQPQGFRGLQPGTAPMLPYEDMPAEPEYQDMPAQEPISQPQGIAAQTPGDNRTFEQKKLDLEGELQEKLARTKGIEPRKQIQAGFERAMNRLYKDEERLDKRKELGFKERTLDLAERRVSRESEQKDVQNFISTSQKRASELPYQKNLLNVAKQSISEGKFGLLSPDNIAEMTGIEAFRTPEGESFRTAIKEYFLQDIRSAGSRPNMFIEKMLANILPNVGKNPKANLAWSEMQRMKIDLDEKKQKLIEQLTPEHKDEFGYPKASLINDVNNKLLDYSNKLQDKTAYKLKEIQELDSPEEELQSLKKVQEGTPLTAKRAQALYKMAGGDKNKVLAVAKKLGYKIVDRGLLNE